MRGVTEWTHVLILTPCQFQLQNHRRVNVARLWYLFTKLQQLLEVLGESESVKRWLFWYMSITEWDWYSTPIETQCKTMFSVHFRHQGTECFFYFPSIETISICHLVNSTLYLEFCSIDYWVISQLWSQQQLFYILSIIILPMCGMAAIS